MRREVINNYGLFFEKCSPQETWLNIVYLIYSIKLPFYVDIQLSFLENINKTEFFINLKDVFRKCLEMVIVFILFQMRLWPINSF